MKSCFYEGTVVHRRLTPIVRAFPFRLFMTYVDLSEIDEVFGRRGLWSTKFPAVARFRRRDYFGDPCEPLEESVRRLVAERTGRRPDGPIRLLTNFRVFGFTMNPVSFYYCFDATDTDVETLVAEVRNTPWGETHCYVIDCAKNGDPVAEQPECVKQMHVSPFLEMGMTYRWRIGAPAERLTLGIDNRTEHAVPFRVDLALARVPITARSRLRMLVRYPLLTWIIFLRIYFEAWRAWRLGVPFVPHPQHRPEFNSTDSIDTGEKLSA
jgi:DUF1365 family protein